MDKRDLREFAEVMARVGETYGRDISAGVISVYFSALEQYSLADIRAALTAHARDPEEGRFMPLPAHLIGKLQAKDGRPTAEEAWAMCPRSEYESVVWTDEMAQAYGIAAPLLEHGDQVAARKAFIDRYESLVQKARAAGTPVKVSPSFGWDAAGRDAAVQKAVNAGLLTQERAATWLAIDHSAPPAIVYDAVKRLQ